MTYLQFLDSLSHKVKILNLKEKARFYYNRIRFIVADLGFIVDLLGLNFSIGLQIKLQFFTLFISLV